MSLTASPVCYRCATFLAQCSSVLKGNENKTLSCLMLLMVVEFGHLESSRLSFGQDLFPIGAVCCHQDIVVP